MTTFRAGDILLIQFPFTDLGATKKRPALVLSPAWLVQETDSYVVAQITSRPYSSHRPDQLPLTGVVSRQAGLLRESTLILSMIATLDPSLIDRKLGQLPIRIQTQVITKLHEIFSH